MCLGLTTKASWKGLDRIVSAGIMQISCNILYRINRPKQIIMTYTVLET